MERECAWRAASRSSAVFFAHPNYGLRCVLSGLWDEALVFGGTDIRRFSRRRAWGDGTCLHRL